jgi:RNA recognition motif-containing protein
MNIIMIDNIFKYRVFLRKFPIDCNSDDIEKKFSVFGKVADVKIEREKGCEVIISFENAEGMKKAVENGVVVLLFSSIFHLIFVL